MKSRIRLLGALPTAVAIAAGCSGGGNDKKRVNDEDNVIVMYENFLPTILNLTTAALAAKETAVGANIVTPYVFYGMSQGTGAIIGTVAQSGSLNETLALDVTLSDYSDTGDVIFATTTSALQFDFNIKMQGPEDNVITAGVLAGDLELGGDLEGTGRFDLALEIDLVDSDPEIILICSHVTGTATVGDDVEDIDFVLVHLDTALNPAQQAKCEGL